MSQHKRANYSTVSPYLIVNGADATIDFLKRVFDAVELRRFPDDTGKPGMPRSESTIPS